MKKNGEGGGGVAVVSTPVPTSHACLQQKGSRACVCTCALPRLLFFQTLLNFGIYVHFRCVSHCVAYTVHERRLINLQALAS